MKCVFVGNLAIRHEIKGKKEEISLSCPSFYGAVAAARMGHEAIIISKLSSSFDKKYLKQLDAEGITLIRQPAWQDTEYYITYDKAGNKNVSIKSDAGPIVAVQKMECDAALINSYVGNVSVEVLKTLKSPTNTLALDAQGFIKYKNPNNEISNVPWLEKENYLKYVDVLKMNAKELYFLTGKTTLNSASELLKLGPKVVTLTLAEQGAYIFYEKKFMKVPVYETKMVEKTGAGDVFATAFALRFKEKNDILDSAYFASSAASFTVEKKGIAGITNAKKVEKRYKTLREIFLA